jgi:hypothetical protein
MIPLVVAREAASAYEWHVVPPVTGTWTDPGVLAEISEFRGRILYANGRRPRFRREGGGYADDDPLDPQSFHVTARTGGELVGYTRIRPLPEYSQSSLGQVATRFQFEAALEEMRLARNDCLEVSRWIVAPSVRGTAVGATLVVSAWAVGGWLGKQCLLGTVGARDGQARMLGRFGGQVLHSIDAKFIAEYDDELVTMYFDLTHPPPRVAAQLSTVGRLIKLADSPVEQSDTMGTTEGISSFTSCDAVIPSRYFVWVKTRDLRRYTANRPSCERSSDVCCGR